MAVCTPTEIFPDGRYPGPNWQTHQVNDYTYIIDDHFGGIDQDGRNVLLDSLPKGSTVYTEYVFDKTVKKQYPDLALRFAAYNAVVGKHIFDFVTYCQTNHATTHTIENFVSCFCKAQTGSKIWLLSKLNALGWLVPGCYSKHFEIPLTVYDGYYRDPIQNTEEFANAIEKIHFNGSTVDHKSHIPHLVPVIQRCFVNIVPETQSMTRVPFWTEKFLYPTVAKSFWVALAGYHYHSFVQKTLGFKLFEIFDYSFDSIVNPDQRHAEMIAMLEPWAKMSQEQWHNIRSSQQHIFDHNYNWLKTLKFVDRLAQLDEFDLITPTGQLPVDHATQLSNCYQPIADHDWCMHFGHKFYHDAYAYWCHTRYGIATNVNVGST